MRFSYHSSSDSCSSRSAYSMRAEVSSFSLIFASGSDLCISLHLRRYLIFGLIRRVLYHIISVTAAARLFPNFSI